MARRLEVEIVGDASSLHRALGQAGDSSSRLGRTLGKTLRAGAIIGGAALAGLGIAAKLGFSEFKESEQVMAQTRAGLKSTGGIAKVTAKEITSLASSISRMSGIDDEAVQASENMLLTFTKVRNEVGRGNNIFDQATLAVANMATKMNNGAIPSMEQLSTSSIRIGKALNDPVKGVTALTKAGVQFTDQQKDQIKALVKSGDTMGAQKIILKELAVQFGGAAKAAGQTLGGQLARLRNRFDEFAGGLVGRVIPALTTFFQNIDKAKGFKAKLNVVWEGVQQAGATLSAKLREAMAKVDWTAVWAGARGIGAGLQARFEAIDWKPVGAAVGSGIATAITQTAAIAGKLAEAFSNASKSIDWVAFGKAIGPGLAAAVVVAFATLTDPAFWTANWDLALAVGLTIFGGKIIKFGGQLTAKLLAPLKKVGGDMVLAIVGGIEAFSPRLASAFLEGLARLPQIAGATLGRLVGIVRSAFARLDSLARFTIEVLGIHAVIVAVADLVGKVKNKIGELLSWLQGAAGRFASAAFGIGAGIVQGIISGIGSLAGAVKSAAVNVVTGALNAAKSKMKIWSPSEVFAQQVGAPIAEGIAKGITDSGPRVSAALRGVLMAAIRQKNFGNVSSIISQLFAQKQGAQTTGSERRISAIERRREVEDLQQGVSDTEAALAQAQAALAQAISEGDPAAIAAAQAVVRSEERATARAKEDVTLFNLRVKAEQERAKLEAAQFVAQLKLTARLDSLQKLFDKQHVTIGALMAAIKKILKSLRIPGFAGGVQNFGGGLALVGEKGPELVNLPRGSDVIPGLRGGRASVVHEHHYHGPVVQDKTFLDYLRGIEAKHRTRNNRPAFGGA